MNSHRRNETLVSIFVPQHRLLKARSPSPHIKSIHHPCRDTDDDLHGAIAVECLRRHKEKMKEVETRLDSAFDTANAGINRNTSGMKEANSSKNKLRKKQPAATPPKDLWKLEKEKDERLVQKRRTNEKVSRNLTKLYLQTEMAKLRRTTRTRSTESGESTYNNPLFESLFVDNDKTIVADDDERKNTWQPVCVFNGITFLPEVNDAKYVNSFGRNKDYGADLKGAKPFRVHLDFHGFKDEEINLQTNGNKLQITGIRLKKPGTNARTVTEILDLPSRVPAHKLRCYRSADGHLTIQQRNIL